jgi:hypothetical protein
MGNGQWSEQWAVRMHACGAGHGYATWLRWFWVLNPSCQRGRPSCYRRRETASPPARQPSPAQHQQRWAPAQTDNRGRSRSRSRRRSQISDNTHRHTDTHLGHPQPAHRGGEAAVGASRRHHQTHRQPRVELCRARRAPWPDQARPRPGACAACCVAALLRRGRTCFDSSERERVPIHVPCHSSHVPHPPVPWTSVFDVPACALPCNLLLDMLPPWALWIPSASRSAHRIAP